MSLDSGLYVLQLAAGRVHAARQASGPGKTGAREALRGVATRGDPSPETSRSRHQHSEPRSRSWPPPSAAAGNILMQQGNSSDVTQ